MAEKPGQIGHPAGPSGARAGDMGKAITERLTFAPLVLASPSCQAHPQRNRRPLSWQVLQMANLPAVTPGGSDITPRTPSSPPSDGRDCPAPVTALGTQELEAGCKRPFGIFHHATSASLHPSRQARPRSHEWVWRNLCEIARASLANGLRLGQNDVLISHEKKERVGAWPWRRGFRARTDRRRLGRIGDHA